VLIAVEKENRFLESISTGLRGNFCAYAPHTLRLLCPLTCTRILASRAPSGLNIPLPALRDHSTPLLRCIPSKSASPGIFGMPFGYTFVNLGRPPRDSLGQHHLGELSASASSGSAVVCSSSSPARSASWSNMSPGSVKPYLLPRRHGSRSR